MSEENDKLQEFVRFQVTRKLTQTTKTFLFLLEEIKANNQDFDFAKYRKVSLDCLNDSKRELDVLFDKLQISLK